MIKIDKKNVIPSTSKGSKSKMAANFSKNPLRYQINCFVFLNSA